MRYSNTGTFYKITNYFYELTPRKIKLYILCNKTRVYPEVSGLAAWSENCKWYSSLPLGAVVFAIL
jgi:hypothetical protein